MQDIFTLYYQHPYSYSFISEGSYFDLALFEDLGNDDPLPEPRIWSSQPTSLVGMLLKRCLDGLSSIIEAWSK